jgi:hypothetical protein
VCFLALVLWRILQPRQRRGQLAVWALLHGSFWRSYTRFAPWMFCCPLERKRFGCGS